MIHCMTSSTPSTMHTMTACKLVVGQHEEGRVGCGWVTPLLSGCQTRSNMPMQAQPLQGVNAVLLANPGDYILCEDEASGGRRTQLTAGCGHVWHGTASKLSSMGNEPSRSSSTPAATGVHRNTCICGTTAWARTTSPTLTFIRGGVFANGCKRLSKARLVSY